MIKEQRTTAEAQLAIPDNISEIATQSRQFEVLRRGQTRLFGGVHINYIMYFFIPLLISACLYSYHMAVKQKQQRPFPHATITNTACHYPQDIVFRFLMLPAGSFICLLYFTLFRWIKLEKERMQFPYGTEAWLYKWALASVVGFYCAIGTIDSAGYPSIHGIGAVFFFIILYIVAGAITIVLRQMHNWDPTFLSGKSVFWKIVVVGYITGVAVYCGVGALLENTSNDDDIYLVTIEWNLTLMGLVWLLTFTLDFKPVFVCLKGDLSKTIKYVDPANDD